MSSTKPRLGVAMIGHAFMGAAHSQAWRTAPRFFDLPLAPAMSVLCGHDGERAREAADRLGWASSATTGAAGRRPRRRRPDRHLHPRRHPRRDRRRGARGRQARAVREAAGQLGRRGRADGRGRRPRRRARRTHDGGVHLPPGPRGRAGAPTGRAGPDRGGPPRARPVPPGLAHRPRGAAVVAAAEGAGRFGRAGRHRCPHRRPDPVHHRRPGPGGLGPARDLRQGAAVRGGGDLRLPRWWRRVHGPGSGHRRRRRGVHRPLRRRGARRLRGDPLRHRPQERDPDRGQRLARESRLRLRGHERPRVLRRHRAGRDRRVPADPRHRGRAPLRRRPGGRRATAWATSTASPTRSSTWSGRSAAGDQPPRPSPTACRSSASWPRSRPAPTPEPGRRSTA